MTGFLTGISIQLISLSSMFFATRSKFNFPVTYNDTLQTYSIVSMLICSFMISISVANSPRNFICSLFWTFQLIFFGITPYAYSLDPNPLYLKTLLSYGEASRAMILVVVCEIIFLSVQLIFNAKATNYVKIEDLNNYNSFLIKKRIARLLGLYLLALIPLYRLVGGSNFFFHSGSIYEGNTYGTLSVWAISDAVLMGIPIVTTSALLYLKYILRSKINNSLLVLLVVWDCILAYPPAHSRVIIIFLLVPLGTVFIVKYRKQVNFFVLMLPLFLLYFSNPVNKITGKFSLRPNFVVSSRTGDYDSFMQLALGIKSAANGTFPVFHQILGPIFFFVPRSFWIGKPLDTGVAVAQSQSLSFQNLSAPWILESYVNFRFLGTIITTGIIAYMILKIDSQAFRSLGNYLVFSLFAASIFILLRGSLLQATGRITFSALVIFYLTRNQQIKNRT